MSSEHSDRIIMDEECRRTLKNLLKNYRHRVEIGEYNDIQSCSVKDEFEDDVSAGRIKNSMEVDEKEVRINVYDRSFNQERDSTPTNGEFLQESFCKKSQEEIDFTDRNTTGYKGTTALDPIRKSDDIRIGARNRGSFYCELIRGNCMRNLRLCICGEADEEKDLRKERHSFIKVRGFRNRFKYSLFAKKIHQFVQNFNRRISKPSAFENESISIEDNDLYENYNSESLKFFYNFDSGDKDVKEEFDETCDYQETLPEIFEDGNFELVDGLITLIENPCRKKIDFAGMFLPMPTSQSVTKKESGPKAA